MRHYKAVIVSLYLSCCYLSTSAEIPVVRQERVRISVELPKKGEKLAELEGVVRVLDPEEDKRMEPELVLRVRNQTSDPLFVVCNPRVLKGASFSVTPEGDADVRKEGFRASVEQQRYDIGPGKEIVIPVNIEYFVRFKRKGVFHIDCKIPLWFYYHDNGKRVRGESTGTGSIDLEVK